MKYNTWTWKWLIVGLLACGTAMAASPRINTPEQEMATFDVAEGYEVNLFASEPDVVNPIAIQFDARGRLWVLNTPTYPQVKPGEQPTCNITILEDTAGDGRADKATVFADGLLLPTGLALGNGGAYVAHGTEMLHLADTTGDGKADRRRVVMTGFGAGDSHTNLNNLQWAPDGSLLMNQGHHSHHSRILTPHGLTYLNRAGQFRWRPRTGRLDAFGGESKSGPNPWGIAFDRWGQPFIVNGPGAPHGWLKPILTRSLAQKGMVESFRDRHLCGIDFVDGEHLPAEMRGHLVAGGYRFNEVVRFAISDDGAGFAGKRIDPPLIRAGDGSGAFRVVDVKQGPDGAIYCADFVQIIIGHYEFSLRDPRRDHRHGRIWRITAKDRPLLERRDFTTMTVPQLVNVLAAANTYDRYQARRVLSEHDTSVVVAQVTPWARSLDANDPANAQSLVEALGVLADHEHLDTVLLDRTLASPVAEARAFATALVAICHNQLDDPALMLRPMADDEHPRVRLEAVVAASYLDTPQAWAVVERVQQLSRDKFLDYAINQATVALEGIAPASAVVQTEPEQEKELPPRAGGELYANTCAACHQPDGSGMAGQFPSLAESKWVTDPDAAAMVRILLHGKWDGPVPMPPLEGLSNAQIAAITNYVRTRWGDANAQPTLIEHVQRLREQHEDRRELWNDEQLRAAQKK